MYDDLRRRNTLDSTLVVLTSDHGDSLGERGHATRYHAEEFRSEVSRVPLLMRLPRQDGAGRRIDGWIGAVDVMPTILDLLDVTPPAGTEGRSWAAAVKALEQPPQVGPAGAVFTIDRNKLAFLSDDRLLVVGLRGPPQLFIIAQDDPAAEDQPLDDPQQLFDYLEAFARYAEEHHLEVSPQEGSGSLPNPALVELLQKYGYWQ
jgi:membrane-anchored protein YejM (alkaline phosphatase superfamily)